MNGVLKEKVGVCCLTGLFLGIAGGLMHAPVWVLVVTAIVIGVSLI